MPRKIVEYNFPIFQGDNFGRYVQILLINNLRVRPIDCKNIGQLMYYVGTRKIVEGRRRSVGEEGSKSLARWQGTGCVGTGSIVVGDRDGYRVAPRGNCQELRGEIKAAPVFRQPIVGTRDTVPGTVLFIRNDRRMEGFG